MNRLLWLLLALWLPQPSAFSATNITAELSALPGPCCATCEDGYEHYYSIPNPGPGSECGECCLRPSRYWFWKKLEPKLLNGTCASQGFTVYKSTERDGVGPIAVTNDRYIKPPVASQDRHQSARSSHRPPHTG